MTIKVKCENILHSEHDSVTDFKMREYRVLYKHIRAGWIAWTGKKGSA